jgi:N-acetylglutamate synthase-like GNAT family acetyltransferase
MSIFIRPAVQADQPEIQALIRKAHLNPRDLHWQNFMIAEHSGRIVGLRQVKLHRNGTREVASGYVLPEFRHQGLSTRLMNTVLEANQTPLYLMCNRKWIPYYERFGFSMVDDKTLPADFARELGRGRLITSVLSLFARERIQLVPMLRKP